LARVALAFTGRRLIFALGVLGLSVIASLSQGSVLQGPDGGVIGCMIGPSAPIRSPRATLHLRHADLLSGIRPILIMAGSMRERDAGADLGAGLAKTDAGKPSWSCRNWPMWSASPGRRRSAP